MPLTLTQKKLVLLIATTAFLAFVAARIYLRDSLFKASERLASAVIQSKPERIWPFVGEVDRKIYGLDQGKFEKFWRNVVAPRTKRMASFKIIRSSENGFEIELSEIDNRRSMLLLASGNEGEYYSPYIIAYLCDFSAKLDNPAFGKDRGRSEASFLAKWYRENKQLLHENGIDGLKTGIDKEFRSIDDYVAACEDFDRLSNSKVPRSESGGK